MINIIEEQYCSFEVSKLLKDKGFEVPVRNYSLEKDKHKSIYEGTEDDYWGDKRIINWNGGIIGIKPFQGFLSRPTHSLAIEWIRINFGIWICIDIDIINKTYFYITTHENNHSWSEGEYTSPQEAYEAALLYVLNNLM